MQAGFPPGYQEIPSECRPYGAVSSLGCNSLSLVQMENASKYAINKMAKDMLDVADNIDRAKASITDGELLNIGGLVPPQRTTHCGG